MKPHWLKLLDLASRLLERFTADGVYQRAADGTVLMRVSANGTTSMTAAGIERALLRHSTTLSS